jgi:hypothetical protein
MSDVEKKDFVLAPFNDQDLAKITDRVVTIFPVLKADNAAKHSDAELADEAIVLAIFAVFNPENLPMEEKDIATLFKAYKLYLLKLLN